MLRNKKTGEIKDAFEVLDMKEDGVLYKYYSLAELNEEWEDYEDERQYTISDDGEVIPYAVDYISEGTDKGRKSIGNCFRTKEEAEKAVEKLKAWKRLKDKGFRFNAWYGGSKNIDWEISSLENEVYAHIPRQIWDDLDLLFGGEE